jgi:hypothetical protein
MVASNPLFHGRWTMKKFHATVLNDIWPEVTFFTLISISLFPLPCTLDYHVITLFNNSGHLDLEVDPTQAPDFECTVGYSGYCARFGHIIQNVVCL